VVSRICTASGMESLAIPTVVTYSDDSSAFPNEKNISTTDSFFLNRRRSVLVPTDVSRTLNPYFVFRELRSAVSVERGKKWKHQAGVAICLAAKNGISSYESHRCLGVTQKTAWYMLQLRLATYTKTSGQRNDDQLTTCLRNSTAHRSAWV
jgi:hypothetical protein